MENIENKSDNKENQAAPESFDKIIEQSKASLAESTALPKRGRGRPKGSPNVKGREPVNSNLNAHSGAENVTPTLEAGQAQSLPALDLKPILKDATKLPFSVAAIKFKMPDLEITDVEAETPAFYLDRVVNLYMPDIERRNPKAFALSAWFLSLFLVGIKKIVAIVEAKKNNLVTVNQSAAHHEQPSDVRFDQPAPVTLPATQVTDAGSIFGGSFKL